MGLNGVGGVVGTGRKRRCLDFQIILGSSSQGLLGRSGARESEGPYILGWGPHLKLEISQAFIFLCLRDIPYWGTGS